MLYRLGCDANLTLRNKESVDIAVVLGPGHAITVDVKAVAGKMDWLMGSSPDSPKPNHFVVLVSYDGRFADAAPLAHSHRPGPSLGIAARSDTARRHAGIAVGSHPRP
jgi:hypothetical protein